MFCVLYIICEKFSLLTFCSWHIWFVCWMLSSLRLIAVDFLFFFFAHLIDFIIIFTLVVGMSITLGLWILRHSQHWIKRQSNTLTTKRKTLMKIHQPCSERAVRSQMYLESNSSLYRTQRGCDILDACACVIHLLLTYWPFKQKNISQEHHGKEISWLRFCHECLINSCNSIVWHLG